MNTNKKTTLLSIVAACLISSAAFSQAIRDRNVIPVAVNLTKFCVCLSTMVETSNLFLIP